MGIYKIEVSKNGQMINSLDKWFELGGPMRDKHWKDGISAKELAKYILDGNGTFPIEIEKILLKIGCKSKKVFKGEPEAVTHLVGRGNGRNHDLFFKQDGEIIIGIEAKADEVLGNMISKELSNKDISDNKIKRINTLYKNIYNCNISNNVDIRYQLLTGVNAILIEAQKLHIPKALFLIITFKKEGYYSKDRLNSNINDISTFIDSLSPNKIGDVYKFNAYPNVELYIEHIEINVS